MKDRLITIAASVVATLIVLWVWDLLTGRSAERAAAHKEIVVDRLVVRKELVVSDTGQPWEQGFEQQQFPRGMFVRSATDTDPRAGGLWVRSRLIKAELDDPFDDRFHALERDGRLRGAPGHISWNVWLDGHWRQMAIIQGEGLELSEVPREQWNGTTHPGRLRFQSFRPGHPEPLTDALIGQGKMSLGGGGFGGGGLPLPNEALDLWGGRAVEHAVATPGAPSVVKDDGSGKHTYSVVAVGVQGNRTAPSKSVAAAGLATLRWDSVNGADAYVIVRDGQDLAGPLRIEGAQKQWTDKPQR